MQSRKLLIVFNLLVILSALLFGKNVQAQTSYGFRIGANSSTIDGNFDTSKAPEPLLGLVAGSYVHYNLRSNFGFQFEVLYSGKGVTLPEFQTPDSESSLQVVYLEVPVLLTYDFEISNTLVPSLHVGPVIAFEISERLFDRVDGFEQSQSSAALRSPDYGLVAGLDVHFNLLNLDMLAGARYTHGLRNLAQSDRNVAAEARTRTLALTLGFLL